MTILCATQRLNPGQLGRYGRIPAEADARQRLLRETVRKTSSPVRFPHGKRVGGGSPLREAALQCGRYHVTHDHEQEDKRRSIFGPLQYACRLNPLSSKPKKAATKRQIAPARDPVSKA